ncbi:hypothetical protein, partial [Mycobacterium alsense]|uniref:hypothetical protein n=1 Tax=Mycobacterium alsense TaxID=324058 RepID=UPI00197C7D8A
MPEQFRLSFGEIDQAAGVEHFGEKWVCWGCLDGCAGGAQFGVVGGLGVGVGSWLVVVEVAL